MAFVGVLSQYERTPLIWRLLREDSEQPDQRWSGDPALREQIFHIAEAQTKPIVMPDCVTDDFGGESVSVIGGSMRFHRLSLPSTRQLDNTVFRQVSRMLGLPTPEPNQQAPRHDSPCLVFRFYLA